MEITTTFKLYYIEKNKRLNSNYDEDPTWKNKIEEIQNRFSETIDNIKYIIPEYSTYTESFACHEWTPFWIAVIETQATFDLPGVNSITEYKINHETLTITENEE